LDDKPASKLEIIMDNIPNKYTLRLSFNSVKKVMPIILMGLSHYRPKKSENFTDKNCKIAYK
jgi:hypothetical protein